MAGIRSDTMSLVTAYAPPVMHRMTVNSVTLLPELNKPQKNPEDYKNQA
jgi:hypothetical protein